MSIVGTGTDLVEACRFREENVSQRLLVRVFTEAELSYCRRMRFPELHLAARFAVKEATVKALASAVPGLLVSQVEVVRSAHGNPGVRLVQGRCSPAPPRLPDDLVLHVSISHAGWYALANVIAEQLDGRQIG